MRIAAALGILVAALSLAAEDACDPRAVLAAHLKAQQLPENTLVLARDHRGAWLGGRWTGSELRADDSFTNLHLSEPTVTMRRDEDLRLFVANTNPLMYSANQTGGELVARTDLADLQQIIGLLANVGTSALRMHAQPEGAGSRATDPLAVVADDVIGAIALASDTVATRIDRVKQDAAAVSALAAVADERNAAAEVFVQRVETNDAAEPRIAIGDDERTLPSRLDAAFAALHQARTALEQITVPCPGAVSAAAAAVDRRITGGNDLAAIRDYRAKLLDLARNLPSCDATLQQPLAQLRQWLATHEPDASAASGDELRILGELHAVLQGYAAVGTARTEALAASATALGKRAAAVRTASAFLDLARRYESHFLGNDPCSLTAGVIEVRRFLLTNVDQPSTKDGKETFRISADTRFAVATKTHPADLTSSYRVMARRGVDVDFDFGAVYTSLSDPEYGVVTRGTELRVEKTGTETRAGQVALFASFGVARLAPLQLQLGAGLSTGDPALYGGVAYQLARYVKLSTGWTMQRVTRLAEGLEENAVVTDASQLRTRDAFGGAWYAAVSITLDELDFFR